MENAKLFQELRDPRGYLDNLNGSVAEWRRLLRAQVYADRGMRSDLTQRPLVRAFDLHEGCHSRRWVGKKNELQYLLFSGPNVFILLPSEHIPQPPSPTTCYWLSCVRYGKVRVDFWLDSLPWKVPAERMWSGSYGLETIARIPENYQVDRSWYVWFEKNKKRLDCEA